MKGYQATNNSAMNNKSFNSSANNSQQKFNTANALQDEQQKVNDELMLQNIQRFDSAFITKFMSEVEQAVKTTDEYKIIGNPFKIAASKFSVDSEGVLLKNLPEHKKNAVYRDVLLHYKTPKQKISRIFDKEPEGEQFKSKIRKIFNFRLEEVRRQIKENKWSITLQMFQSILMRNKGNRDLFDILAFKELPNDFRQLIWKYCLENNQTSDEYAKKLRENRLLTISRFDVQIIKDTESFVSKMIDRPEDFDGSMMFAMKTILSYYELKQDRILSDYLYYLCIPLMYTFGNQKHMHKVPTDLIGFFFNIQQVAQFFDPLIDLIIKHDEKYEAEMTDYFMNTLQAVDEIIATKFSQILNLENPSNRTLLVLIIKRFVHSLGFAFLPITVTQYVWDQIFMKVIKNRLEIFVVMSIMCVCIKEKIMACQDWDHIVDCIYQHGKQIDYEQFITIYREIFKDQRFYLSPYNVNPEIVNRERGDRGEGSNPLAMLLDEQSKRDKKAFKKKWREGGQQDGFIDDEEKSGDEEDDAPIKQKQIENLKIDDVMKGMKEENKPAQAMGMVPVVNPEEDDDEEDDEEDGGDKGSDEDEEKKNFDPLAGFKKK